MVKNLLWLINWIAFNIQQFRIKSVNSIAKKIQKILRTIENDTHRKLQILILFCFFFNFISCIESRKWFFQTFHAELHQYKYHIELFNQLTQKLIAVYPSDDTSRIKRMTESVNVRWALNVCCIYCLLFTQNTIHLMTNDDEPAKSDESSCRWRLKN